MYSASVVERATVRYFFTSQHIAALDNVNAYPVYDLLSEIIQPNLSSRILQYPFQDKMTDRNFQSGTSAQSVL